MSETLPPLPEFGANFRPRWPSDEGGYSADQMRSYAAAAVAAATDEVERLTAALANANSQAEHFEREWYLRGDEVERLAAAAALAQREPLTDEQINAILQQHAQDSREMHDFARAIERAHGITEPTHPEPLSDEQIAAAYSDLYLTKLTGPRAYDLAVARAVERAHGISAPASAPKEQA